MGAAFICDATRTPFGRYGGALSQVRVDDLAALPLRALLARNPALDPSLIDEVILGHTNEPEYKRLQGNEMMEAFRDRTIKIDVPYNIRLDDEIKIYNKDFGAEKVRS